MALELLQFVRLFHQLLGLLEWLRLLTEYFLIPGDCYSLAIPPSLVLLPLHLESLQSRLVINIWLLPPWAFNGFFSLCGPLSFIYPNNRYSF